MRLFGLTITRQKAAPQALAIADNRGSWWPLIKESFTGAWQQNVEVKVADVLTFGAAYRCISLISSDIAKMRVKLVQVDDEGVWSETYSAAYSPVLRKPNAWQTRIQFFRNWMESKLVHGNAYVLKQRDNRGVVTALYVLDPTKVQPLVAPDGAVYYELSRDDLARQPEARIVAPAKEIIHDRGETFYHPLVGLSPIYASGLAAIQGLRIQHNSATFFGNASNPGGVLTAPGAISDDTAKRLKATWDANYSGANAGKVAVLGDGLHFEQMMIKATDAQLIEQLRWTSEQVCSAFGVPAYKVGVGATPTYNNIEALNSQYYSDCLQQHIEEIEVLLDEGLGLGVGNSYGTEFDLDGLLRMDTATQIQTYAEAVRGGLMKPNEARNKIGLKPTAGGDAVYLQEQNYSLEALAKRDAQADPFSTGADAPVDPPAPANDDTEARAAARRAYVAMEVRKGLA